MSNQPFRASLASYSRQGGTVLGRRSQRRRGTTRSDLLKRIRDAAPLLETDRQAYGKAVETITEVARKALGVMGEFELNISSNRIMMGDDDEVYKSEARTNNLAFDLFRQGLRRLTFRPGLDLDEVEGFVRRFAECRSAEQIDEDFVTMMWQDSSSHIEIIAIDMFTEKIFMSEAEFIKQFREVLDDVAPGLIEMDDDEEAGVDKAERPLNILTHHGDVDRADIEQRKIRKTLTADQDGLAVSLMPDEEIVDTTHHLLHLAACQILSERSVLSNAEFQGIWVRLLTSYLEEQNWQGYADAMRSISALLDLGRAFSPDVAERFDKLRKVILGRDMAEQIADHILPENTQFFS